MKKALEFGQDIVEFSTLENECVYGTGNRMKMRYKYIKDASLQINSNLVQNGWRRFGNYFSCPDCDKCSECQSLKIDVKNFTLSKSQRRVYKKNKDTLVLVRTPSVTKEHLELYKKYHDYKHDKNNWDKTEISLSTYQDLYIAGHSFYGKEILYFINGKLVGVDLVDFLEDGISAIYFYYDPDFLHLSLGKYSLLKQIDFAKELNLDWIYLGYAVKGCKSLNYKFDYKPHKILQNNPNIGQEAIWK